MGLFPRLLLILLISSASLTYADTTPTRSCMLSSLRSLTNAKRYSKVDGTRIFTIHEYLKGLEKSPQWKSLADKIRQVRKDYAPRMKQRRTDFINTKDFPGKKAPGYGYERMKRDAEKMSGKTVQ